MSAHVILTSLFFSFFFFLLLPTIPFSRFSFASEETQRTFRRQPRDFAVAWAPPCCRSDSYYFLSAPLAAERLPPPPAEPALKKRDAKGKKTKVVVVDSSPDSVTQSPAEASSPGRSRKVRMRSSVQA